MFKNFSLILRVCLLSLITSVAVADSIRVTLINGLSSSPLPHTKVSLDRMDGAGNFKWLAGGNTDSNGKIAFDVTNASGATFRVRALAYGHWTHSESFVGPKSVTIKAGTLPVTVIREATGKPLAGWKVSVSRKRGDGQWQWVETGISDEKGIIRFGPSGLGSGTEFRVQAKSPVDGAGIVKGSIINPGPITFKLGNTPLTVQLSDAISNKPLPAVNITIYKVMADGSQKWFRTKATDSSGKAIFDLPGLGKGQSYQLRAKPYEVLVKSPVITTTGNYNFEVGTLPVKVLNGVDGSPLVGINVSLTRKVQDGKWSWVQGGITNNQGIIHFDPHEIGDSSQYRFRAKSLVDGTAVYSEPFSSLGQKTFILGNVPLEVRMVNALTGQPLAGIDITAREILSDGSLRWAKRLQTNNQGMVQFDLPGLGQGRLYRLDAKPYGVTVRTESISTTGQFEFKVGALQIKLVNRDTGKSLAGRELIFEEKFADGKTVGRIIGTTDASGIVHFDDPGLNTGKVFVIAAKNPFGQGKRIYSQPIFGPGAVTFAISSSDPSGLDRSLPELGITSPSDHGKVAALGFQVRGWASDKNGKIGSVKVTISDPVAGKHQVMAQLDTDSNKWLAEIPANTVTSGQTAKVVVEAFDDSYNRKTAEIQVQVIDDQDPPQLAILSPAGGNLSPMGFLVTGTVSDQTPIKQVAGILKASGSASILQQAIEVSANGRWAWAIPPGNLKAGEQATIRVEAEDEAGHIGHAEITLPVVSAGKDDRHFLNRITFGATPELLDQVRVVGRQEFLRRQLHPEAIDDSIVEQQIASSPEKDITEAMLVRMICSRRHLNEVMTWFWENHFNTSRDKTRENWEYEENESFRAHALGKFRDLLEISAKSPTMLRYLDNYLSSKQAINENYARELMELHTMGVDGGYTHQDIVEVARAFTGWRIDWDRWQDGSFFFDSKRHDTDEKVVLGHVLPAGRGIEDGQQVLDILASHPSTAKFICTKLARVFVSDNPQTATVSDCASVFLASDGDIRQVVENLLTSNEFESDTSFHAKYKTPLEFVTSSTRALHAQLGTRDLIWELGRLSMPLFFKTEPTGWPEIADKWIDSNQMMARFFFANHLAFRSFNPNDNRFTTLDLPGYFAGLGLETAEGIVGHLFSILASGDYTQQEWDMAYGLLTEGLPFGFSLQVQDANWRLQKLVGFVMALPETQLQ